MAGDFFTSSGSPQRTVSLSPVFARLYEGMTVFEPGPGKGYFTIELARLAGRLGRVVAIDVQPNMLAELRRRAGRAGLRDRIDARQGPGGSLLRALPR